MAKEQGASSSRRTRRRGTTTTSRDTYEAGLVLQGTEVKSLRQGRASPVDGFVDIDGHEAWLHGVHPGVLPGHLDQPPARRKASCPQPRGDRQRSSAGSTEKGLTVMSRLRSTLRDGRAKVEIALARGQEDLGQAARHRRRTAKTRDGGRVGRRMKGMRD